MRHKQVITLSEFKQFYGFIRGKQNRLEIVQTSGVTRKTVSKTFQVFFRKPLTPVQIWSVFPPKFSSSWVYSVDGKWLKRQGVVLIHRNVTDKEILFWSWAANESYAAMRSDLIALGGLLRHKPVGVVSDWKGSIRSGVVDVFGRLPHQRCLAHISRDIRRVLASKSPLQATMELRRIGLAVSSVKTHEQRSDWMLWLSVWEMIYGELLTQRSYYQDLITGKRRWWYTHKKLRAGFRILNRDQESLFTHLDEPIIPSTNNGLEAINGDLKIKLANHRGMKYPQQYSFIGWYLIFSKVKTNSDLKKLWDLWRSL